MYVILSFVGDVIKFGDMFMTNTLASCPSYESVYPNFNEFFTGYSGVELDRPPAFNPEYGLTRYETGSTLNERSIEDVTAQVNDLKQACNDKADVLNTKSKECLNLACLAIALWILTAPCVVFLFPLLAPATAVLVIAAINILASAPGWMLAIEGFELENEARKLVNVANNLTESSVTLQLTPENIHQVQALRVDAK